MIDLKQDGCKLYGQYCAVAQNGNKVDCDDDENIDGDTDEAGKEAIVNFSSFFGARNGVAEIKVSDGHSLWHVLQRPTGGEFYAPNDAVLDRN
ncbi:hypothetical protein [Paraburkholderia tagetis]|uniref:Uncharacterized protein n=1 Tax=Paraburkholderia tagetis TaxID=2913261 RepID=A0A9X1RTU0_9BURK|nr:hypothetical protein [Paraburkholderia tagetis]MCG5074703.1 hypothetical protein [Paraburkholderia tagetis]